MSGLRTRTILNDYGRRNRALFLRPSLRVRIGRWLRRVTFGVL